ncbi:ribokinase [Solicola gregarius]|uniref:Deoxyribokinase n=1 Tax=Solicola gregarius TaxID=2908642 RepID=A0AA46TIF4_9ACTN|nr:ribokinase [Solicola gregarius]UYM05919.1 ribokinase [Solicola gregarius]
MLGSFMMDLITRAPRRPVAGETLIGTGFSQHLGGKGLNQAVAAARSGAHVRMIGAVGDDDYGRQFLQRLDDERIDGARVMTTARGTGVGLPLVEPGGENSIVVVPRANLAITPEDVRAAASMLQSSDVVLLQQELPLDAIAEAARIAHDAGVTVMLNPAPVLEGTRGLSGLVDILVPNEPEARSLTNDPSGTAEAVGKALLDEWDLGRVVLTLGPAGALVVDRDGATPVRAHAVDAVDTVGAGDAFCGSLAAGLARGDEFPSAVRYANVAAALSVTRAGGADSVPTYAEVSELMSGD